MTTTITIPKYGTEKRELIAIPRKEYKVFARWRKLMGIAKAFTPTPNELKALKKAREDYRKSKYSTPLDELRQQLEITD